MSFRDFSLTKVQHDFGLTTVESRSLFAGVPPRPISAGLSEYWRTKLKLGLAQATEKGRSELVTAPLIAEVWSLGDGAISLLSGQEWEVDVAKGLNGVPDFLLCRSQRITVVEAPVLTTVEAKRDSIPGGFGQCAAEMVAAQIYNARAGKPVDPVYGCVTTGAAWKFLRLSGTHLEIDLDEYSIDRHDKILGILCHCCGLAP